MVTSKDLQREGFGTSEPQEFWGGEYFQRLIVELAHHSYLTALLFKTKDETLCSKTEENNSSGFIDVLRLYIQGIYLLNCRVTGFSKIKFG